MGVLVVLSVEIPKTLLSGVDPLPEATSVLSGTGESLKRGGEELLTWAILV